MNLKTFAEQHRLKTKLDSCGEIIIEGRNGQIYEHGDNQLAVLFAIPSKSDPAGRWCPKIWNARRKSGEDVGMTVLQNGDSEGTMLFDAEDRTQVKVALKIAKVRPKRQMAPEQVARFIAAVHNRRNLTSEPLQIGV